MKPFFYTAVTSAVQQAEPESDLARTHLYCVERIMAGETITGASKPLERYSILPGKTFASSPASKQKFKVLRLIQDDVVYQDLTTKRIETVPVDRLLRDWAQKGLREVSLADSIIETVREVLGPVLGSFLTAALISWLFDKLSR